MLSFAFSDRKKLYFGRDVIGRHSLVLQLSKRNVNISSICSRSQKDAVEVPAVGIFCMDLSQGKHS